jgi:hypothetical protein
MPCINNTLKKEDKAVNITRLQILIMVLFFTPLLVAGIGLSPSQAAVGDQVHQITVPVSGIDTFCSIGLAFDGTSLYYDRCGDSNIYEINPVTGALISTFNTNIPEFPNCLAFDATRNGTWIGAQGSDGQGMPIYFWDFFTSTVTKEFTIPSGLINPATGEPFLELHFCDGLAFNANNSADASDDELWFSDDVDNDLGLFRPDGTLVNGYDATIVDPSLATTSGLAIGGLNLYMGNNGGGDVFRADSTTDPLTFIDQFTSGDLREEDMECDPVTFAPTEVMWVRTTPQGGLFPDVITAYEIEPGTCTLGGGGVLAVDKDYRFTDVCFEKDDDMDGEFSEDPVNFDPVTGLPIDDDGDGLFNEDDTECPDGTALGMPLPMVAGPDGLDRHTVFAVLKKNGTVSSYNPGQYYAVSTIDVLIDIDELIIWEDYSDCVDKELSALNPPKGGGKVVIIMVGPDGIAKQIMDAKSPNVTVTGGTAHAHIMKPIPAGTTVLMYVKFGPGLKNMPVPPFDANTCINENSADAQIGDAVFSESATADLMVRPKP